MIVGSAARAAAAAARDALRVVSALGSHAMWWLDYRANRRTRRGPEDDRR